MASIGGVSIGSRSWRERLVIGFLPRPQGVGSGFVGAHARVARSRSASSRLSPGTLLIAHAIEEVIREGAAIFDFLRGQERYKYFWGAGDAWSFVRRLTAPAPAGLGRRCAR
jgi:hypothetical protein